MMRNFFDRALGFSRRMAFTALFRAPVTMRKRRADHFFHVR
jgi:hypothetical protein